MAELHYDYKKAEVIEINFDAECSIPEAVAAIGRLIQIVQNEWPKPQQFVFKALVQALVTEDSPIWKPVEGIRINMNALRRQAAEGGNE